MIVECEDCGAIVNAELVSSYDSYEEATQTTGRYSFLKCPKCERPFIMLQTDGDVPLAEDNPWPVYPVPEMGLSFDIPFSIRKAFSEARVCFRAKAYTAAAIMCRKTLEGIAEEHKITSRNLAGALKEMREKGIIENRLYEWADALRISGNEAAHGVVTTVSAQDAKDTLEFTKALIEYVFTFQDKFRQWNKRRELRNQVIGPSPPPEPDDAELTI